jgi:hypothetical protein
MNDNPTHTLSFSTRCSRRVIVSVLSSIAIIFALIACGGGTVITNGSSARATREPTLVELARLRKATNTYEGGYAPIKFAHIATKNPTWSRVQIREASTSSPDIYRDDIVFHYRDGAWSVAYVFSVGQLADGGCAYVPASVMRDLFGITCPPERALHARRATVREQRAIRIAMLEDQLTRRFGNVPLEHCRTNAKCKPGPCVSRLDSSWASAIMDFQTTSGVVWFKRTGSVWRVADETSGERGVLPPHKIVLSLASCVGYNAAEYGGGGVPSSG